MAKELIVSVNGREKKIAIIENEKVTEFYIERGEGNQGIVGNIYKGRVMRVLPGMQSAFVDIGLERDAFLYVSDFFDEEEEFERIVIDKSKKGEADDAQRIAAEQIALGRVEREHQMEATQERAEPLQESEASEPAVEAESSEESEENKRRGRRGRDGADAARKILIFRLEPSPNRKENESRRRKSAPHSWPPILRFIALLMTRRRPPSMARCSRTRAYKNVSLTKFMPANSIWKKTFARLKLVQSCLLRNFAVDHFSG